MNADELVIPDVVEPFRGYRVWRTDGTRLLSLNNTPWPWEVPLEAECVKPSGPWFQFFQNVATTNQIEPELCESSPCTPEAGEGHVGSKGCGIFAANTFDALAKVYGIQDPSTYIVGEVLLWGRVWPYTDGFRAQFAEPSVIYDNGRPEVWEVARRYG